MSCNFTYKSGNPRGERMWVSVYARMSGKWEPETQQFGSSFKWPELKDGHCKIKRSGSILKLCER